MGLGYKFFQQLHPYSHPNEDKIYYSILPQAFTIKGVYILPTAVLRLPGE